MGCSEKGCIRIRIEYESRQGSYKPFQAEHYSIAYKNLRDAFQISFGSDAEKWPNNLGQMTDQDYFEVIKKKQLKDPESMIHVWHNQVIIGQIEMSIKKDDPKCGYVSLYYLVPEKRGCGLGKILDQFTLNKLKNAGCITAELTVEPSNKTAIAFYKKQGWVSKGSHPVYTRIGGIPASNDFFQNF